MPFRPQHSLLRVEVPALQSIDTSSVENLFGMVGFGSALTILSEFHSHPLQWSLFSKTSHAMESGRRLENLSWRLWNRETFCCDASSAPARATPPISFSRRPKAATADIPMPALSSSPDFSSSDESDEETTSLPTRAPIIPKARPELRCCDSTSTRSRGREKHITPTDLEKIVISIQENKELDPRPIELPISTSMYESNADVSMSSPHHLPNFDLDSDCLTEQSSGSTAQAPSLCDSQRTFLESSASTIGTNDDKQSSSSSSSGSDSSSHTEMSTHSIVRGFNLAAPSSYRSQTSLATQPTPMLRNSARPTDARPTKKGPMFTIGTSSGEEESSLESHMLKSTLSESLRRSTNNLAGTSSKKQTSFKEEVAIGRAAEHSPVFESDDEDDEDGVSESAIEDEDDSSEWESDQSAHSSVNEKEPMFQRVDSRPNLTSRRSLLTTLMHEPDRARALANAASRSTPALRRSRNTTPNGPSVATSPDEGSEIEIPPQESSRGMPIIMTTSNTLPHQLALSPRTTRRNMLSTELTESLRKNLLWERQHRSTGNLAALRRRHTSNDMRNLKQHPDPAPVLSHPDGANKFTNEYFNAGLQEYHSKGW